MGRHPSGSAETGQAKMSSQAGGREEGRESGGGELVGSGWLGAPAPWSWGSQWTRQSPGLLSSC